MIWGYASILLTLGELEKSQDTTYQNLKEGFFVFPEGENSEERFQSQQRINDIVMSHRYAMAVYDSNKQQYEPIYEATTWALCAPNLIQPF